MDINSPTEGHFHGSYKFDFAKVFVTVYWTSTQRWCVRVEERNRNRYFYTDAQAGDTFRTVSLRATGRKRLWAR